MGINSQGVAYNFGQLGSGFSDEAAEVTPPTGKVIVAITFLADTVFDNAGLTSDDNTMFPNDTVASTGIDADGGAVTDSVTFPKGVTIYGRWTSILLDSGSCIAYVGY